MGCKGCVIFRSNNIRVTSTKKKINRNKSRKPVSLLMEVGSNWFIDGKFADRCV